MRAAANSAGAKIRNPYSAFIAAFLQQKLQRGRSLPALLAANAMLQQLRLVHQFPHVLQIMAHLRHQLFLRDLQLRLPPSAPPKPGYSKCSCTGPENFCV